MTTLSPKLELERCPHCNVAKPNLTRQHFFDTRTHTGENPRTWAFYACSTCGGVVTASSVSLDSGVFQFFPGSESVDEAVPKTARAYLTQAMQSLHAPAGAVMLAASAVDAMLKEKKLQDRQLV